MERGDSGKFLNARYVSCCAALNFLVGLGLILILYNAFMMQVIQYPTWVERARAQTVGFLQPLSYRGSVYDREGRLMAISVPPTLPFGRRRPDREPQAPGGATGAGAGRIARSA